ncbi:MAG TPA: SIMPL domain-containing protein [Acidimicrobiales bacterium]|jgi:hypothetical protein|nr:SIMPL domain-containing protein [Acidimicrobiales bacterium]
MSSTSETTEARQAPTPERVASEQRRFAGSPIAWLSAVVAILVVVIVAVAGAAYGRSSNSDPTTATITVTGTGTIQGTSDTVSFNIGIHTTRASAAAALEANNLQLQSLESTLKRYGVPLTDQQTSGLSIYQQTNQYGTITGFSVDDTLDVTVTSALSSPGALSAKAGRVIDAAASRAGNGIDFGGVTFSISNESRYLASARRQAMQNAMAAASQLAAGANRTVTGIARVTDQENSQPMPVPYPFYAAADAALHSVPIQVGRQPVNVQVTVVYTLS